MLDQTRVLVADQQLLTRVGLIALLRSKLGAKDIVECSSFQAAINKLSEDESIQFVMIGFDLSKLNDGAGLDCILTHFPRVRLILLADIIERDSVLSALSAGVHGYISKTLSLGDMTVALRTVFGGQIYVPPLLGERSPNKTPSQSSDGRSIIQHLTDRQREVLELLAAGRTNKEIARSLSVAEGTVKVHMNGAFRVLGVRNRVSAVAALRALENGDRINEPRLPGLGRSRGWSDNSLNTHVAPVVFGLSLICCEALVFV